MVTGFGAKGQPLTLNLGNCTGMRLSCIRTSTHPPTNPP